MVMDLAFHTKYPDGVEDTLKIFLFPNLYPSTWSEAALFTRKWDMILGGGTLTSFAYMSLLMGNQKVAPIAGWDKVESQLEARGTLTVNTPYPKISRVKEMGTSLL